VITSVQQDADGREYGFHGVYHGMPSPDRIGSCIPLNSRGVRDTSASGPSLSNNGETTVVRQSSVFQSVEDRDGELQSGTEQGARDSAERLDELISRLVLVS
jgi:uncharacterized protein YndB with AHSA1/START domain